MKHDGTLRFGVAVRWVSFSLIGIAVLAPGAMGQTCLDCSGTPPAVTDCIGDYSVCGHWVAILDCPSPPGNTGSPWPNCWPNGVESVHEMLTPTGTTPDAWRVLLFRDTNPASDCFWNAGSMAHLWDPGEFGERPPSDNILVYGSGGEYNLGNRKTLFCAGHAVLPDGKVIVVGGTDQSQTSGIWGLATTFLFDPKGPKQAGCNRTTLGCPGTTSWLCMDWTELAPSPALQLRRWYPTVTLLPDGRAMTTGGHESQVSGVTDMAEIPEIYNRVLNGWTSTGAPNDQPNPPPPGTPGNMFPWYPLMFVLPGSGTYVLHAGPQRTVNGVPTNHVQTLGNVQVSNPAWANFGAVSAIDGGMAVLYDKGRILKNGSPARDPFGSLATASGEIINVNLDGTPGSFVTADPMKMPRNQHNLVILPDGTVFSSGGGSKVGGDNVCCSWRVLDSEIWTPGPNPTDPGSWRRVAAMNHRSPEAPRMYHSTSLLLPDGRVLSSGGECLVVHNPPCFPEDKVFNHYNNADFYEPPYLYKPGNVAITAADRPTITSNPPPQFVAYGEGMSFQVSYGAGAAGLSKVAFVRPGSTTHNWNMEQRYVPVTFSDASGTLTVTAANMPNARLAPPGYYMLFLVNNQGAPSVAPFVNLWGIVESSVQVAAGQTCGTPGISFQVRWDTTIPTDGNDHVEIYAPGVSCPGTPTLSSDPPAPSGAYHQHTLTSSTCTTSTWKVLVRSNKLSTSVSQVSCKEFQVTCISCPPPCRPPCEIE